MSRMAGMRLIATRVEKRRSCGAVELPDRDAELLGLVGEVRGDAGARKHDDADRHHGQHLVVAARNGAALAWRVQSGLKAICVTLRALAKAAAMRSAPLGLPPWSSTMPGCLREPGRAGPRWHDGH